MLGHQTPKKNVLWPIITVLGVGWLGLVFVCHFPTPTDEKRETVRSLVDFTVRAYDYARHHPELPGANELSINLAAELAKAWPTITRTGLASDELKIDWSLICVRMAKDADKLTGKVWRRQAKQAFESISQDQRAGDYYAWSKRLHAGESLSRHERECISGNLATNPQAWCLHFLAEELGVSTAESSWAVDCLGHLAFLKTRASEGLQFTLLAVTFVLFVPALRRLMLPAQTDETGRRIQRLWPLSVTLLLVIGSLTLQLLFSEIQRRIVGTSWEWYEFYSWAGPELSGLVWQGMFFSSFAMVICGVNHGLTGQWTSFGQVLGLRWSHFFHRGTWIIAIFGAAACISVIPWVSACITWSAWGDPLLDGLSRWQHGGPILWQITALAFTIIVGPLYEELLFRGYLFAAFQNAMGRTAAVVFPSLLFAVSHAYSMTGTLDVLLIGLMLACIRLRTGRIAASILTHFCINLLLAFEQWLSVL